MRNDDGSSLNPVYVLVGLLARAIAQTTAITAAYTAAHRRAEVIVDDPVDGDRVRTGAPPPHYCQRLTRVADKTARDST